jgi:hypothetical protein
MERREEERERERSNSVQMDPSTSDRQTEREREREREREILGVRFEEPEALLERRRFEQIVAVQLHISVNAALLSSSNIHGDLCIKMSCHNLVIIARVLDTWKTYGARALSKPVLREAGSPRLVPWSSTRMRGSFASEPRQYNE